MGPAAIRFPKTAAVHVGLDEVGSGLTARRVVEGASAKVALVGVGKMLGPCLSAAERLAESGIHATVWDPRVVKPLDPDMLADLAAHPLVITIEDGLREGGIGAAIADSLRDLVPVNGPCVRVLGVPVAYIPHGKPDVLLASMGLDAEGIVAEYQAFAANSAAAR